MSTLGNYLENIGISGWSALEPSIFVALKTKTPLMLIGEKGTSKTEFCRRIALAIRGRKARFQKYDTPDVSLDQVLGFMNIAGMSEGRVDFVRTGTSIWDKTDVTWDEINRVGPMMQGKLLEIVRTGKVHGLDTDVVMQYGTCNPPRATKTSTGGHSVHFLEDALASRFFHVHVPKTSVALYNDAMSEKMVSIRNAFTADDQSAIAGFCKPIQEFWLDFSVAKYTDDEFKIAKAIVADVLVHTEKQDYFDIRAAVRTTNMLAEALCLIRITRYQNVIPALQQIVIGNIPELNGILRNDKSGDTKTIESRIAIKAQSCVKTTSSVVFKSTPFKLLSQGKFAEPDIESLLQELASNLTKDNVGDVVSGFLKKIGSADDKYRSADFRRNHKQVLQKFLDVGKRAGFTTIKVTMFPQARNKEQMVDIGEGVDIKDLATRLHDDWYIDCGLGGK